MEGIQNCHKKVINRYKQAIQLQKRVYFVKAGDLNHKLIYKTEQIVEHKANYLELDEHLLHQEEKRIGNLKKKKNKIFFNKQELINLQNNNICQIKE